MSEIPTFTPLGTEPPNRSMQEDVYVPAADAFAAWIPGITSEMEIALSWTAEQLTLIGQEREEVLTAVGQAADSATVAEQARLAAAAFANFKGRWSDLEGALLQPASVFENGKVWVLLTDLEDVTLSQPGVSGDWASEVVLQGEAAGPINMAGYDFTASSISADRIDYASAATTDTLDLASRQVFRVDASSPRTLAFNNAPGAARAMTVVVHITGNSAITWPAGIDWDSDAAPELGDNETKVVLFWDGVEWSGFTRVAK